MALAVFLIARFTLKRLRSRRIQRRLSPRAEDWSTWTIAPLTREPLLKKEKDAGRA